MGNVKRASPPVGLPGDKEQKRLRRARLWGRIGFVALAISLWLTLVLLVGPARVALELPPLGPATRDLVALNDFDSEEPIPDLAQRQDEATTAVPLRYAYDAQAAARRIDSLHAAFGLVRPRYRLYVADRDRLLEQARNHPRRPDAPDPLVALDKAFDEELERLRPEFESAIAPRRSELSPDIFSTLRKAGFADEIELLLSDVAQVLLNQKIVREIERFEDDLGRGILITGMDLRLDRKSPPQKVVGVEQALAQADQYAAEFIRQKTPSKLDEPVLQAAVRQLARGMVEPTFQRDLEATHAAEALARESVAKTRVVRYTRGQSLVKRGDLVTPVVQERVGAMQRGVHGNSIARAYLATALLLAVLLGLFTLFGRRHLHHFRHRPRDIGLLAAILVLHAASLRGWLMLGEALVEPGGILSAEMWLVAMPMALGPSLASLFLKPFTAAPFALVCAGIAAMTAHNSPFVRVLPGLDGIQGVLALVVGLAGVQAARQFRTRVDLLRGAILIGGSGVLCAAAMVLFTVPTAGLLDEQNAMVLGMGAATGLTTYLLLTALTPVLESSFNRLTDIKLLELASMNHPALRLLATEAPGTFTHSVMVGNLAQAGCDAIQANGLLARVGAYYHDLGKTRAARYFAENQGGDNPHDRLKPHLSALIIKSHVKDGIKILKDFRLPDEIIDFVPQHHGTSLILHFFHRAQREAMENGEELAESDFRYSGPKPQRKETAMLMIADAVEAAAKALPDPNPVRVQALVKRIISGKLEDGQLDECDLTLREMAQVEQAFVKTLLGMHHTRPTYLPPPTLPSQQQLALSHPTVSVQMHGQTEELKRIPPVDPTAGSGKPIPTRRMPTQHQHHHGQGRRASDKSADEQLNTTGQHDRPQPPPHMERPPQPAERPTVAAPMPEPMRGTDAADLDVGEVETGEPEAPTALIAQKSPPPRTPLADRHPPGKGS